MESLFTPLKEKGLTSLKIQNDWRTGVVRLYAAKEWDPDTDFSRYNKDFYAESILTEDAVFLNTKEVWAMYEEYGLTEYLKKVIDLIKAGKHFGIEAYYYDKYDIRFMHNQHSRKLGVHNKRRAIFDGGIRRHELSDNELDAIIDGLNLGRAMSFKNAAAGAFYGGAKTVVQMDPVDLTDMNMIGFFAYCIDCCRGIAVPDMKFPKETTAIVNKNFSKNWTASVGTKLGPSGVPTGIGVYYAIKTAMEFKTGSDSLDGKTIAVQGLGEVGRTVADCLTQENTKLLVADMSEETALAFKNAHPDHDITIVPTDEILKVKADVLCPCAMGGIITEENIPELQFDIIIGAANNQLKATCQEEEIRLASLLEEQGILFQVDWWHNFGGVTIGADEYELGDDADFDKMIEKVIARVKKLSMQKFIEAKEKGISPTEAVYREVEEVIYGDKDQIGE